jgi:hypothetical protein
VKRDEPLNENNGVKLENRPQSSTGTKKWFTAEQFERKGLRVFSAMDSRVKINSGIAKGSCEELEYLL